MYEIVEFNKVEQGLKLIKDKHESAIIDVSTSKGMNEAKANRRELRELRIKLEAARKNEKEDILKMAKFINSLWRLSS